MAKIDVTRNEVEHARLLVESRLRDLAANLMRIARGAGKAYELEGQLFNAHQDFQAYRNLLGHGVPPDVIQRCLNISEEPDRAGTEQHEQLRHEGLETTLRGAVQVAASRLMGQRTQEIAGGNEMADGMRLVQEAREKLAVRRPV